VTGHPAAANSLVRLQPCCPALQIPDKWSKVRQNFPGKLHMGKPGQVRVLAAGAAWAGADAAPALLQV